MDGTTGRQPRAEPPKTGSFPRPLTRVVKRPVGGEDGAGTTDLQRRVLSSLQSEATRLPASVAAGEVQAVRKGQLVRILHDVLAPERKRFEDERARWQRELAALELELQRAREERDQVARVRDETRRQELPRLAALVDEERTRAERLEGERTELQARIAALEADLVAIAPPADAAPAAGPDAGLAPGLADDPVGPLLRAAQDRLAAAAAQPGGGDDEARDEDAGEAAAGAGAVRAAAGDLDDPGPLGPLLARAADVDVRLAGLEQALRGLSSGEGAGGLPAGLEAAGAPRPLLALLEQAAARQARLEARVEALVTAQEATQAALEAELRRRQELEGSVGRLAEALGRVERARRAPGPSFTQRLGGQLGPHLDELRAEARAGQLEADERVRRLGVATRAALERMAEILDRAIEAGVLGHPWSPALARGRALPGAALEDALEDVGEDALEDVGDDALEDAGEGSRGGEDPDDAAREPLVWAGERAAPPDRDRTPGAGRSARAARPTSRTAGDLPGAPDDGLVGATTREVAPRTPDEHEDLPPLVDELEDEDPPVVHADELERWFRAGRPGQAPHEADAEHRAAWGDPAEEAEAALEDALDSPRDRFVPAPAARRAFVAPAFDPGGEDPGDEADEEEPGVLRGGRGARGLEDPPDPYDPGEDARGYDDDGDEAGAADDPADAAPRGPRGYSPPSDEPADDDWSAFLGPEAAEGGPAPTAPAPAGAPGPGVAPASAAPGAAARDDLEATARAQRAVERQLLESLRQELGHDLDPETRSELEHWLGGGAG